MKPAIHPDEVFEGLKTTSSRSQKLKNLDSLHALCRAQHQGSKDFSLPIIGKLWEASGGIKSRALYNAASQDYRTLITAWETHCGPVKASPARQSLDSKAPSYLSRIEDPAIRSLVQAVLIERDKLRAEVNLLKSMSTLRIDLSPKDQTHPKLAAISDDGQPKLTPAEKEALAKAISQSHLESEGWLEGSHGEILNDRGRRIFEAGFCSALRKIAPSESDKRR